jgi:phage shock protein A
MTDSIATRVTRIVSGSVHALLDAVENAAPEAVMTQAIREVEQVTDEVRAELGKIEAAKHLVGTQISKLDNENENLHAHIETAIKQGRDELARAGVEKQLNIEDQMPVLQKSLAEQKERGNELEGYITALLAKKREMEQALQEFVSTRAPSFAPGSSPAVRGSAHVRVDKANSAFDRVLARQTGVAGLSAGVASDAAKIKELQELHRNQRIDEKLAQLKARQTK